MRREELGHLPIARGLSGILLLALSCALACWAQEAPLNHALNEQIVLIRHGAGVELETTIFKPDGNGPFPLALINHGKAFGNPRFQPRARYIVATRELVRRGYAVAIPMRGGFSKSSGMYVEGGCNIEGNANHQAGYLRTALDWLVQQPYVDRKRIVVMGQSHGGLTAMAFAAEPYDGVLGVMNFAGGLRLSGDRCTNWESSLISAFRSFGGSTRISSLWFYGENDSYFNPDLVKRMYAAFSTAGGKAKLIAYGPFKGDAHGTFSDRDGLSIWWPEADSFLNSLGLPTALLPRAASEDPAIAALEDIKRIPFINSACTRTYNLFLDADYPRAYAISTDGHCGYAYGGEEPRKRAVEFCQKRAQEPCKLYAIDNGVVWHN